MNINTRACPRISRPVRPLLAALVAGGCVCAAAVPAQAQTQKPISFGRNVTVRAGVLSKSTTVKVNGVVSSPVSRVSSWWSVATVAKVVRYGVNGRYQQPYGTQGYRCTPTVKQSTTSYVCTLRGADVPTSVRLTFAVTFAPSSVGSGTPVFDHSLEIDVTGLPAAKLTDVVFANALVNPYSSTLGGHVPTYTANGPSSLTLPHNAVVISAGATSPINATLKIVVALQDANATDLTGHADIPDGATVTINVDGHGAKPVSNGSFDVPLS